MWHYILNWFRSRLSRLYIQILAEIDKYKRFLNLSKVNLKELQGTEGIQQVLRLHEQSSALSKQVQELNLAYQAWTKLSWLFDYFLGNQEAKENYLETKSTLIEAINDYNAFLSETQNLLIHYADLDPIIYARLLPENTPISDFYKGYAVFNRQCDFNTNEQYIAFSEEEEAKEAILNAIEGKWPAEYLLQQKFVKALYLLKMRAKYHEEFEDPKEEAKQILSDLVEAQYPPAYLYYANLLWEEKKQEEAIQYYLIAVSNGSIKAMYQLGSIQYGYYHNKISQSNKHYPSFMSEENYRQQIAESLAKAAFYFDHARSKYLVERFKRLFDEKNKFSLIKSDRHLSKELLYFRTYFETVESKQRKSPYDFSIFDLDIHDLVSKRTNKLFSRESDNDKSATDKLPAKVTVIEEKAASIEEIKVIAHKKKHKSKSKKHHEKEDLYSESQEPDLLMQHEEKPEISANVEIFVEDLKEQPKEVPPSQSDKKVDEHKKKNRFKFFSSAKNIFSSSHKKSEKKVHHK